MSSKFWIGIVLTACLCLNAGRAAAQLTGFKLGNIGPSKAQVIGAIVGTAAVIGVVVYLVIPKQKKIEGCVVQSETGLQLTNDKGTHAYALDSKGVNLQAGQRVSLKGKPGKRHSGTRDFRVNKLLKDEGTCSGALGGSS